MLERGTHGLSGRIFCSVHITLRPDEKLLHRKKSGIKSVTKLLIKKRDFTSYEFRTKKNVVRIIREE